MLGTMQREGWVGQAECFESRSSEMQLRSVDEYVDREAIEAYASDLIMNRAQIQREYKTTKTYHDDARTALFEALTASGHLSRVELSGELEEIHMSMLQVLLNAWSDENPPAERARQFQELCNELSRQAIERGIANEVISDQVQVSEISDFPTSMGDKQALRLGYRPFNKKGMVRNSQLFKNPDGSFTRVSEQVSRSNSSAERSADFLKNQNIDLRFAGSIDASVLGNATVHEMSQGVIGMLRRLDEHQGVNIRHGEILHDDQLDYNELRMESMRREQQAECFIDRLATFTQMIDRKRAKNQISQRDHERLLQTEIQTILRAICTMAPSYAKDCFGDEASVIYHEAADMVARGDVAGASGHIEKNQHKEQAITLCGMTISQEDARAKGIENDSLRSLLTLGKEKWKYRFGTCRVDGCPSPKSTKIGPCDVCLGNCQPKFDKGMSYERIVRIYKSAQKVGKATVKKVKSIWTIFQKDKNVRR